MTIQGFLGRIGQVSIGRKVRAEKGAKVIQVPLIKELVCYVCGKGITEKDSVRIGGGLRRHRKCKPVAKRPRNTKPKAATPPAKQYPPTERTEDELFP